MKKESLFKKIFASKQDCCSVEIEKVEEETEKVSDKATASKNDSSCCSPEKE
ncbi:hypothetical protein [Sporosarcina sp. YIM B06819]|uniref:hypothetical protein n=1 Tax=Sporosarcina sp. YIM B06819 TaxID=3081769 RepID=UPI00298BF980|nr:hypothetical protein [Sporosarcina sp. YIM B06819]